MIGIRYFISFILIQSFHFIPPLHANYYKNSGFYIDRLSLHICFSGLKFECYSRFTTIFQVYESSSSISYYTMPHSAASLAFIYYFHFCSLKVLDVNASFLISFHLIRFRFAFYFSSILISIGRRIPASSKSRLKRKSIIVIEMPLISLWPCELYASLIIFSYLCLIFIQLIFSQQVESTIIQILSFLYFSFRPSCTFNAYFKFLKQISFHNHTMSILSFLKEKCYHKVVGIEYKKI